MREASVRGSGSGGPRFDLQLPKARRVIEAMMQLCAETYRLGLLRGLEDLVADGGFNQVAGVDEAGRGCLAGPVVAAAVIPDPVRLVPGVDDSKVLTAIQRRQLAPAIRQRSVAWSVAFVDAPQIDRINILEATRQAMTQAVATLPLNPDLVLVDAVELDLPMPSLAVIRGDAMSYSIAAASILAKEARDRYMIAQHEHYPVYGFAAHKGYGAAAHREALATHGPCPLHRLTFRSVPAPSAALGDA